MEQFQLSARVYPAFLTGNFYRINQLLHGSLTGIFYRIKLMVRPLCGDKNVGTNQLNRIARMPLKSIFSDQDGFGYVPYNADLRA